ncbi:DUF1543 domain-containing protein [Chitinophaga pinensis]|uniref:DUF1543 domain-containing protein n=1 Tax=Chitinophaga pinensis (strain ATCC 43595 / DSM 2588 / LMG 13176 / NBRC 15968 / NCIMB 11800 / UQM 2034) TaxID=485918 RepID=A0A979G3L1_CHIPD|nr:DUF1543 domain-containing protein [Chitinophaga pinensis]ACU60209.1 protein of unknown function DUF1543 [Chitinophaga pinensis DSM 2588]
MQQTADYPLKLYMVLLGSRGRGRHVEQHDYFFGIAASLRDLVPQMKAFWPEAGNSLHIDGWREVTNVDGYSVTVIPKTETLIPSARKLFFINLGGYQSGKLEEQHDTLLTVQDDRTGAMKAAKRTDFFKTNAIPAVKGANTHIDEKYGIDVDEIYRIDDLLAPEDKVRYQIRLTPAHSSAADEIHLGYFQLHKI